MGPREEEEQQMQKPSMHARAAREGRGGTRGGRGGGRMSEREDADPEPQVAVAYGRGGMRGQRGKGGAQHVEQHVPIVAMGGGQLRPQGAGGRDFDDRVVPSQGRNGYQGTDRGGMGGMRGGGRGGAHVERIAPPMNDRGAGAVPPQRTRGRGGMTGQMVVGRVAAPAMVHQPQMRVPVNMYEDVDDPNDPFPALTKSHSGGRPGSHEQTVTVNIRGLGGRGPVQRTALDSEEGFVLAELGMPAANANRPGGRRAGGPGEYGQQNSITPSLAMAPLFTPTSSMPNSNMSNMGNIVQISNGLNHQQQQQQKQVWAL